MRTRLLTTAIGLFAFFAITPAFAASGSIISGSGATTGSGTVVISTGALLPGRLASLKASLNGRIPASRYDVILPAPKVLGWTEDLARMKQKKSSLRTTCYMDIRYANRDTVMPKANPC